MSKKLEIEDILALLKKVKQTGPDSWEALCPAHDDKKPSLHVARGRIQPIVFDCKAGCELGDILAALNLTLGDICAGSRIDTALRERVLAQARRTLAPDSETTKPRPAASAPVPVNGQEPPTKGEFTVTAEYVYTDEQGQPLYKKIRHDGLDEKGEIAKFCIFKRHENGKWIGGKGCMDKIRRVPYNLHEIMPASEVWIVEGEKCADALIALGLPATTGDAGADHWDPNHAQYMKDKDIIILPDQDKAGDKYRDAIKESLIGKAASWRIVNLPGLEKREKHGEDVFDWIAKGHTLQDLLEEAAKVEPQPPQLSVLSILDIISINLPADDNIMGDRVLADSEILGIVGAGGIGKTREILQMTFNIILGQPWGNLPTYKPGSIFLTFGTENSIRRMQNDFGKMLSIYDHNEQARIVNNAYFLCPINTDDWDVALDSEETQTRMKTAVRKIKPGIVIFDPFGDFFDGDNENDGGQTKSTLKKMRRIATCANPRAATIVLNHSGMDRAAIAGAFGLGRMTFNRASKAFYNKIRCQINIIPGSEDEDPPLIIDCAKNNNGKKFKRFAHVLDEKTMHYAVDPDFDFETYIGQLQRKPGTESRIKMADNTTVRLAMQSIGKLATFTELRKAIIELSKADGKKGCGIRTADGAIAKAVSAGIIMKSHSTGCYHFTREYEPCSSNSELP